jgi:zinc/manganese transport system substrate-binding protein
MIFRGFNQTARRSVLLLAALAIVAIAAPVSAADKLKVVATLPTVAAFVRAAGGDRVEVVSLSSGTRSPHSISPTPSLMRKVRGADLMFEIGMQLEIWADAVAEGSGNPQIKKGAQGRVAVSRGLPKLDVPKVLSRAEGDVHPEGNPHVWLDPARAKLIVNNIARALGEASPENVGYFEDRARAFARRIDKALFGDKLLELVGSKKLTKLAVTGQLQAFLQKKKYRGKPLTNFAGGWLAQAATLRGKKGVEFHKIWSYLASTFGFFLIGTIEEKPGIAPGPRHLAGTIERMRRAGASFVIVEDYRTPNLAERVAGDASAKLVVLPTEVGPDADGAAYVALIDAILTKLVAAVGSPNAEDPASPTDN